MARKNYRGIVAKALQKLGGGTVSEIAAITGMPAREVGGALTGLSKRVSPPVAKWNGEKWQWTGVAFRPGAPNYRYATDKEIKKVLSFIERGDGVFKCDIEQHTRVECNVIANILINLRLKDRILFTRGGWVATNKPLPLDRGEWNERRAVKMKGVDLQDVNWMKYWSEENRKNRKIYGYQEWIRNSV